jgi:hypothetical protein
MDTRHLVDGIVRQTTILIAQLSTAAGIRAPLARVADQIFLDLARELEAQGVTRKVAADMFGLALRSYQKKIQRLSESATDAEQTLWSAVLGYLREQGGASRKAVREHFAREDELDLAAVLKDLVSSGLLSCTGRGATTYYELASEQARERMADEADLDVITTFVWLAIYDRKQIARADLIASLPFSAELSERAIAALIEDERVERASGDALRCTELSIPVGSEQGWETAVFDHFRSVATAIAAKLRLIGARSKHDDVIGGSTVTFNVHDGHPFEPEVYGMLQRVRADVNQLWAKVTEHNREHGVHPEQCAEVTFYFGQNVVRGEPDDAGTREHVS